jgi:uncharacterized protein (TIGR03089 family)
MSSDRVAVPQLLARLRRQDSGRPRVTWYGADGERVELSARVLENWVAKTANLLVEELEVEVGDAVRLDLPAHWRTVAWRLAVAAVGGELVAVGAAAAPDVLVVADGSPGLESATSGTGAGVPRHLVVQSLGALAFRAQVVPPGALDAAAVVAGYGDELPAAVGAPGLVVTGPPSDARVLVDARSGDDDAALDAVLAALAGGGSAVLLGPGSPDPERVAAQEGTAPA